MIRARICRRDIADEPVARIATLARIGCDFILLLVCVITDDGRLERGKRTYGFSEMVRKTGFDAVASGTPSTRSAWLSYVLIKKCWLG